MTAKGSGMKPLLEDYAPYHLFEAFAEGVGDYRRARLTGPYGRHGVEAQAWDRGAEYAMRLARWGARSAAIAEGLRYSGNWLERVPLAPAISNGETL
jgi:hypothetical protein